LNTTLWPNLNKKFFSVFLAVFEAIHVTNCTIFVVQKQLVHTQSKTASVRPTWKTVVQFISVFLLAYIIRFSALFTHLNLIV